MRIAALLGCLALAAPAAATPGPTPPVPAAATPPTPSPVPVTATPPTPSPAPVAATPPSLSPPPAQSACPPPPAAATAELTERVRRNLTENRPGTTDIDVTAVCELRGGWLMDVSFPARDHDDDGELRDGRVHIAWIVPSRGRPNWLLGWSPGPVYDFDGDGRPEPSTLWHGTVLEIWFSGGRQSSRNMLALTDGFRPEGRWASWNGQIVYLTHDEQDRLHAFGFRPGEARREILEAACRLAAPGETCATAVALPRSIPHTAFNDPPHGQAAAVLGARATRATCAQLDDAAKIEHARVIEQAALRRLDPIAPLVFTWGCVSHGASPVVVHAVQPHDSGTAELWTIRSGRPRFERAARREMPDEWAEYAEILLTSHADLDGDGFDESIIAEFAGKPLAARYTVTLAGSRRELPSDVVVRGADGARDGIARLPPLNRPVPRHAPCEPVSPDACMPSPPPVGWWPVYYEAHWDWEHEPPQILAWRGERFAPIRAARLAEIIAETAAARAAQPRP
jgi:hypothetical protein